MRHAAAATSCQGWAREQIRPSHRDHSGKFSSRLVEAVGRDLSRLALAVEQLGLYAMNPAPAGAGGSTPGPSGVAASRRAVTSDDVDDLIADTRERSVFELTDAIGAADRARALAAVSSLCDQRESAVGVVVMLARHIRQLSLVHAMRAANTPRNEWGSRLGVPPFIVDKIVAQARAYSPAALAAATRRLAEADRALKGDQTLTTDLHAFTGPQLKALGKELGERVILEQTVDHIVQLAG